MPPADVGRRRPERRLGPEPVRQTPVAAPRAVPGACAGRSGQVPLPRSRVEGVLPGMGPRPPLPAVRVGRRSARRGRRVRENESPERAFGGPRGPPGGAGGGRASTSGGPWQGGWGRRGVSVSLGRGSASGGCPEKARLGSPGVGPSAPGRARRRRAASAEHGGRRGPRQRRATSSNRSVRVRLRGVPEHEARAGSPSRPCRR